MQQKYNRILPESEGNVFCAEIGQRVTLQDYQSIFEPAFKKILSEYKEVKALLSYSDLFLGWDFDAAAYDLAMMTEIGAHVKKVALVDPPEQVQQRWLTLKPLLGGPVHIFNADEFQTALAWVRSQ